MLELGMVAAGYGRSPVLQDIDLDVAAGEVVTLIGANGAGKSSTLRTISGLLVARSGEIRFCGDRINGLSPHEIVRRGIVHVPEGRHLFNDMTVRENLLLGGYTKTKAASRRRIEEVFALFPRVKERERQRAGSLSGGEQQMVAIGRGLMAEPKLLMLDEPSLGLAPKLVRQVGDIVTSIRKIGITVLLVEQNARMALNIADRAYILQTGRIILSGRSAALRNNPAVQAAYLGVEQAVTQRAAASG
jgi:branched-chain amino acid transport system ATP-binding protein